MSICDKCNHKNVCGFRDNTTLACNHFQKEVVRCKNCRFCEYDDTVYRKTVDGEENKPAHICFRSGRGQEVDGNHFCSCGERKGDGE